MEKKKHELAANGFKKNYRNLTEVFFIGQSYFFNDGVQLYLIFQLFYYTLEKLGNTRKVVSWKSKGFLIEKIYYSYHYWYYSFSID